MDKDFERLSKHVDRMDKEYSSTLSEILTDLHFVKSKINKDSQLDYEQKHSDIECKKQSDLQLSKTLHFMAKFFSVCLGVVFVIGVILCLIKDLFF